MSKRRNEEQAPDDPSRADGATSSISSTTAIVAFVIFVVGRGGKGKTTLVRWLVHIFAEVGLPLVIADGDRTNQTLRAFFDNATSPEYADDVTVKNWTYANLERCAKEGQSLVFDFGGGDTNVKKISKELPLVEFLVDDLNMTPIVIHLVGDDPDDLAYVRDLEAIFAPQRTAVIMNEGVIPGHHNAADAFTTLLSADEIKLLIERKAKMLTMPVLLPAGKIVEARLSFEGAVAGDGEIPLGPTNRRLTREWLKQMRIDLKPLLDWLTTP